MTSKMNKPLKCIVLESWMKSLVVSHAWCIIFLPSTRGGLRSIAYLSTEIPLSLSYESTIVPLQATTLDEVLGWVCAIGLCLLSKKEEEEERKSEDLRRNNAFVPVGKIYQDGCLFSVPATIFDGFQAIFERFGLLSTRNTP